MEKIIAGMLLGWLGGAVVNYLADVLPRTRSLSQPVCSRCSAALNWRRYLLFQSCGPEKHPPGFRSWVVSLTCTGAAVLGAIYPLDNFGFLGILIWVIYFCLVIVIDLEHRLILHPVSLAGALLALGFGTWSHGFLDTLLGGAAGFGGMLALYFLGAAFVSWLSSRRGEEINEVALGFGDVNLSGVVGLLLGWPGIVAGLFGAVILGGIVSGVYLIWQLARKKYEAFQALPYGPFIVLSTVALILISRLASS